MGAQFHRLTQAFVFLALFDRLKEHHLATFAHCERVARATADFARFLRLPSAEVYYLAGLCHDVGKVEVPVPVLDKAGPLDPEERAIIDRHGPAGAHLLKGLGLPTEELAARHHHERWDGTGVPDGLAGDQIPLAARVVALADAYTAMTEDRPYRPRGAMSHKDALGRIASRSGSNYDPVLTVAFLSMKSSRPSLPPHPVANTTNNEASTW